ncbi:MAG: DUF5703 domain-containing protein [Tannerella sp.]|nr:DUF5703 domain-containing protein [Tannerella sp.]
MSRYNITWDSPAKNSSESMPCGGSDIGLNVWVGMIRLCTASVKARCIASLHRTTSFRRKPEPPDTYS